jgi:hypothetical membrane protein
VPDAARRERLLLACGAVGPPLFVLSFLVQGAVRPDYSPLRHPISSLSLGPGGWAQAATFVLTGGLVLAFAAGLHVVLRRAGRGFWLPVLVGLVGVGLVGAGVFATEPIGGYPPGTPVAPAGTPTGTLHDLFSLPVFTALPAACLVAARGFASAGRRGLAVWSGGTAIVFLAGFVAAGAGFAQQPALAPVGGLLQRVTITLGFAWLTAMALLQLRGSGRPRAAAPAA